MTFIDDTQEDIGVSSEIYELSIGYLQIFEGMDRKTYREESKRLKTDNGMESMEVNPMNSIKLKALSDMVWLGKH